MPKDFGTWFAEQGQKPEPEPEETYLLQCSCGKQEIAKKSAYENGDTGWYSDDPDGGYGLCGGPFCLP